PRPPSLYSSIAALPASASPPAPFFFTDTATTAIYTLSLHDALPISAVPARGAVQPRRRGLAPNPRGRPFAPPYRPRRRRHGLGRDRKSTRLNSSHVKISYAVFCLKKKKTHINQQHTNRPYSTTPASA